MYSATKATTTRLLISKTDRQRLPCMASLLMPLVLLSSVSLFVHGIANHAPQPYVVYMGSSASGRGGDGNPEAAHLQVLSTIIPREERERLSLIQSYSHAFKGFTAMLTEREAALLSGHAGVVSVFPDRILQLHTTRSWAFLDAESGFRMMHVRPRISRDVIIGIVDTGIWPESPSFNDAGIGEVPSRWKGICMEGSDFKKSDCNRKLIGARYYHQYNAQADPIQRPPPPSNNNNNNNNSSSSYYSSTRNEEEVVTISPRDEVGHGTHTASIAAGAVVLNASYYGLAGGEAKGGSPSSRLAVYKACSLGGCASSNVLKAIDDAINDGVDVISISVGISSIFQSDFLSDPIAIGAFHAHQRGVLVVCSGGNDGPDPYTVVNSAPWILTVAASSIDRTFQSTIVLGNAGNAFKGTAINFSNLTLSRSYPLVFGGDAAAEFTPVFEAINCYPGSLDERKTAGKIIVCVDSDPTVTRRVKKLVAEGAGAKGLILIDVFEKGVSFDSGTFPFSEVGHGVGTQILNYINSTRAPRGTILPSVDVNLLKPAPVVAYFSARGPGGLTESILKPDMMAPGVGILGASIPVADTPGKKPSNFAIKSGTSMACPHVAGAAAFIRSVHPHWTPSVIRSALMTTATTTNNLGKVLTTDSGAAATHHEMGSGEISPLRALHPGLVYETSTSDYLNFLCYYGYKQKLINSISGVANFTCPSSRSEDDDLSISNLNYPSISIAKLDPRRRGAPITVRRTVTNVGPAASNATYTASVDAPAGLAVRVSPERLFFSSSAAAAVGMGSPSTASFRVSFDGRGAEKGYAFGSVTWSDGSHSVRTVFAVNVV